MFDGKFLYTLMALVIAVVAICNFNPSKNNSSREDFLTGISLVAKPYALATSNGKTTAVQDTFNESMWSNSPGLAASASQAPGISSPEFFQVPGTFQSNLSPRFGNTDFGSNIRYNAPSYSNMAIPKTPLGYANMTKENFGTQENYGCDSCGGGGAGCFAAQCLGPAKSQSPKSCSAGDAPPFMNSGYTSGDFSEVLEETITDYPASDGITDTLPISTMTTVDSSGAEKQVVMYDQLIMATRNDRTRSQGCWTRGDLPIPPCSGNWFQVAANPTTMLLQGAMNVLTDVNPNSTTAALTSLINNTTGSDTVAGALVSQQELASFGAAGNDIQVTAFP